MYHIPLITGVGEGNDVGNNVVPERGRRAVMKKLHIYNVTVTGHTLTSHSSIF